jgi:hypothetical protein
MPSMIIENENVPDISAALHPISPAIGLKKTPKAARDKPILIIIKEMEMIII